MRQDLLKNIFHWYLETAKKILTSFIRLYKKTVPALKPYYASNMIGCGSFSYLDSKKQKKDWPIISLANQKDFISIYVCALIRDKDAAEKNKKDLGKLTQSLSCIRFKTIEEINLETLKTVFKLAEKIQGLLVPGW